MQIRDGMQVSTAEAITVCTCGSIGRTDGIRQCPEHFHFWYGDKRMSSVGSVIQAVWPTDWSKIDPAVLANAQDRGKRVDVHFSEYVKTGNVSIPAGERQDVIARLDALVKWWDRSGLRAVDVQGIAFSERDGIAGMFDIRVDGGFIDLKVVAALQPSYALQLGSYVTYGDADCAAILHSSSKGVKLVEYDAAQCREWWATGVAWWKALQEISK